MGYRITILILDCYLFPDEIALLMVWWSREGLRGLYRIAKAPRSRALRRSSLDLSAVIKMQVMG